MILKGAVCIIQIHIDLQSNSEVHILMKMKKNEQRAQSQNKKNLQEFVLGKFILLLVS